MPLIEFLYITFLSKVLGFGNFVGIKNLPSLSFSQEGEDMVLRSYFGNRKGLFIDVGCHHPWRYSNSYWLYLNGWRGLNIDPSNETIKLFSNFRGNDKNLEIGISNSERTLAFYEFNEPALNTFDKKLAESYCSSAYRVIRISQKSTKKLSSLLTEQKIRKIDFLNVDAEGLDFEVLKSLNLRYFQPEMICVETNNVKGIDKLLISYKYKFFASTGKTSFYVH